MRLFRKSVQDDRLSILVHWLMAYLLRRPNATITIKINNGQIGEVFTTDHDLGRTEGVDLNDPYIRQVLSPRAMR
jgi:hypothetical protein